MSCKSCLFCANTSGTDVEENYAIPFGSIIRRFGKCCDLYGNDIILMEKGYYQVDVSLTLAPNTVGDVTVEMLSNNVNISGLKASAYCTTAETPLNLSIYGVIRVCDCENSRLSLVLTENSANIENISTVVIKL